jgi:hypothetical protein
MFNIFEKKKKVLDLMWINENIRYISTQSMYMYYAYVHTFLVWHLYRNIRSKQNSVFSFDNKIYSLFCQHWPLVQCILRLFCYVDRNIPEPLFGGRVDVNWSEKKQRINCEEGHDPTHTIAYSSVYCATHMGMSKQGRQYTHKHNNKACSCIHCYCAVSITHS